MPEAADRLSAALSDRYRIERELGHGGMATVYLAEDLKHHRRVAIKVLKPELAAVVGAERFVQEIETTAQLQHPHILPLFDSGSVAVGESGSGDGGSAEFLYYVMPYVEGETLREKLNREKQLGIDEAVKITVEVADALQYAHEQGVIHRDIKPENILLHAGRPMVADFGIALALSAAAGGRMTETGLSLGTPHYMSPEQATAERDLTNRSDIYSLGCVLYEMLAGHPPHRGESAQQVVLRIISEPAPAVTTVRHNVPPNVAAALAKALEQLPADRFATAKAFAAALTNPSFTGSSATSATPATLRRSRRTTYALAVACVVLAAVAAWGWLRHEPAPAPSYDPITLGPPVRPGAIFFGTAIAPDGSAIVYTDTVGGRWQLWIRERDRVEPRVLASLANVPPPPGPTFSPDGRWIAFTDGHLEKIARDGGPRARLSDTAAGFGAAWLDDGTIVFIGASNQAVFATRADGGPTTRLLTGEDALPGRSIVKVTAVHGAHAVFITGVRATAKLVALDLVTDSVRDLGVNAGIAWAVDGRLVYITTSGQLLAVPFDIHELRPHGAPTPILQGIRTANGVGDATLGRDGTLLYAQGASVQFGGDARLESVGRDGAATWLDTAWTPPAPNNSSVELSPDGTRLAVSVVDETRGTSSIYVMHLATGIATRLTFDGTTNVRPAWSPDGKTILYVSDAGSGIGLWTKRADGSGRAARLPLPESRAVWEGLWSPDGQWIVYRTYDAVAGNGDIYAVRTSGDTTPRPMVATDAEETSPVIAPDGRWLAYASSATGRKEIYVRPFPNASDGIWQISTDGGTEPVWSHSGNELFYRNAKDEMVAVAVSRTRTFTPGTHTTLFDARPYLADDDSHYFAVTPNDARFLMFRLVNPRPTASSGQLVLVRHWMERSER